MDPDEKPSNYPCPENSWSFKFDDSTSASHLCHESRRKTSLPIPFSTSESSFSDDTPNYIVKELCSLPKLHRAVWSNDLAEVKSICSVIHVKNHLANITDSRDRTALHLACAKGLVDIIFYLCDNLKGIVDVNLKDMKGCTPIYKVVELGSCCSQLIECLIDCGGDPNLANDIGETPLHHAASYGDDFTTSFLIFKGASVNVTNKNGQTPLHLATVNDHKRVVAVLIVSGADIGIKDKFGITPIELAYNDVVVQFIHDLYADQNPDKLQLTEEEFLNEDHLPVNDQVTNTGFLTGDRDKECSKEKMGGVKSIDSIATCSVLPFTDVSSIATTSLSIANSNAIEVKTSKDDTNPRRVILGHESTNIDDNITTLQLPDYDAKDHNEITCKERFKFDIEDSRDAVYHPGEMNEKASDNETSDYSDILCHENISIKQHNEDDFQTFSPVSSKCDSNVNSCITPSPDSLSIPKLPSGNNLENLPSQSCNSTLLLTTEELPSHMESNPVLCHESTNTASIRIMLQPPSDEK